MSNWNNKNDGTVGTKSKKIVPIKNYIVKKIDENQNIKRLCRYQTKNPLAKKSQDYNNTLVQQPLLQDSLIKPSLEGNSHEQILIPYMFEDNIVEKKQCYIFVHPFRNNYDGIVGENIFALDIIVPYEYNEIDPYSDERLFLIVNEIVDMFDGMIIDDEYVKELGLIEFKISGRSTLERLSKTTAYLYYPVFITTRLCNARYRE